jgi:hypothetical protein
MTGTVECATARCVKIPGGLATTSLNTGIEVNTVRIHIFVIAAAGLVFGCTDPEPMAFLGDLFEKKQAQQGGEGKPQAAEPTDGYIKVEIRGKIIFENGKGYSVSVQLSKDRQCTFSLVIPENKVLVVDHGRAGHGLVGLGQELGGGIQRAELLDLLGFGSGGFGGRGLGSCRLLGGFRRLRRLEAFAPWCSFRGVVGRRALQV